MLLIQPLYVPSKGLTILPENKIKTNQRGRFFLPPYKYNEKKRVPLRAHISKMYNSKRSPSNRAHIAKNSGRANKSREESLFSNRTLDGHLVFGNPALPVPENSKAEHSLQKINFLNTKFNLLTGSKSGHSVFGSPAAQVPENPKAEHPSPIFEKKNARKRKSRKA